MATSWKLDRCREAIERLSDAGLPWDALSGEIITHLRRAVGFDGWCAALCDPANGLPSTVVAADSPVAGCQRRFWQLEYEVRDAGPQGAAARPVAVLSRVTGGDLARSRRWDELLRPAGTADELRAALTINGWRWGSLTLYRAAPGGRFPADEVSLLESLRGPLSQGARGGWTAWAAGPAGYGEDPATLVAAADGTLVGATPTAGDWLARLGGPHPRSGYSLVYALVAAVAHDAGRNPGGLSSASLLARTIDGHWAELAAAPLTGTSPLSDHVAIAVRPALPARIRGVLTRAYALSDRERQVARLALDGLPVADIAAVLCVSPHTAKDHVKAIFRKTRSHTRHQLAARLGGYGPGR